jgi:phage RecT family recombinase
MTALTVQSFATNEQTLKLAEYFKLAEKDFNPWVKSALIAISTTASLQECMNTPAGQKSLYESLRFAASTGLSLNPQEGKAALIAYKGKAQYQIMKNGMMELAQRSGKVKFITCDTVRENDDFSIEKTAEGDKYSFKPARKDRGEIDGFFAAVVLTDGSCNVKYMTVAEAHGFRDNYSSLYKNKPDASPWKKSFEGMATKTVIKALLRNLNISPEISEAVGIDDQEEVGPAEPKDITPDKGTGVEKLEEVLEEKTANKGYEL